MSKNKNEDTNIQGRLFDGWAFLVRLKDGQVERLCDYDRYEAVLARWLAARKGENGGVVSFSGAHAEADGPLDGIGARLAEEITGISNYSTAAFGVTPITEQRLAALENGVQQLLPVIENTEGDLSDLIEELRDRRLIDADKWAPDEGDEEGGQEIPGTGSMTMTPAGPSATTVATTGPVVPATPGFGGGDADEDEE